MRRFSATNRKQELRAFTVAVGLLDISLFMFIGGKS